MSTQQIRKCLPVISTQTLQWSETGKQLLLEWRRPDGLGFFPFPRLSMEICCKYALREPWASGFDWAAVTSWFSWRLLAVATSVRIFCSTASASSSSTRAASADGANSSVANRTVTASRSFMMFNIWSKFPVACSCSRILDLNCWVDTINPFIDHPGHTSVHCEVYKVWVGPILCVQCRPVR